MRIYFQMTVQGSYCVAEEPGDMKAVRELIEREHARLMDDEDGLEWLLENNGDLQLDELKLGPE